MADTKIDIQQSVVELAYQPLLDPAILNIQQSVVELAYQPIIDPAILNIQQSVVELAYQPILEPAILNTQQSVVELAYLPKKVYDELLSPISDTHNSGSWSGSPLYTNISITGSDTYILSPITPSGTSFEIQFPQITNYNKDNDLIIHTDISKVTSGSLQPTGDGDIIDVTFDLLLTGTVLQSFELTDVFDSGREYLFVSGVVKDSIQDNDVLSLRVTANTSTEDVSNPRFIKIDYLALGIDADIFTELPSPLVGVRRKTVVSGKGKTIIKFYN